jgi:hypothetical protein
MSWKRWKGFSRPIILHSVTFTCGLCDRKHGVFIDRSIIVLDVIKVLFLQLNK